MRAALGKPFSKHCPELHGMNSDGLCLTIRFSVAEAAFKKQFSDGLLASISSCFDGSVVTIKMRTSGCRWFKRRAVSSPFI